MIKSTLKKIARKMGLLDKNYWGEQQYLEKSEFKYILWLDRIYSKIGEVPGHIVELGVAYGRNAIIFSHLKKMHNEDDVRKYYGFDTFDGYTDESISNSDNLSSSAWKGISIKKVTQRINKAGFQSGFHFYKGDILKTVPGFLAENPDFKAALLYIDCNAYEPAIAALEAFKDHMTPGAVICIDEKKQGGETRALIEFCKKHNFTFKRDNTTFSIPAYTVVE